MKCIGTQERLKTKFGSGYLLTIFSEPGMIQECTKFVETNLPFVELEENFANVLSFRIQKVIFFPTTNGLIIYLSRNLINEKKKKKKKKKG